MRIVPADAFDTVDAAGRLTGGEPRVTWQFDRADAALVRGWFTGVPVDESDAVQLDLARRLVAAGLADVEHGRAANSADIAVVIPIRDEQTRLDSTISTILNHAAPPQIIVVDDGSATPITVPLGPGIRLVRLDGPRGPGAARNAGAAQTDRSAIAFVDAGVDVDTETLRGLAGRLGSPESHRSGPVSDPVAVAPRVRIGQGTNRLAAYEGAFSPIDMGADAGRVSPERRLTYLPGALLVVDAAAFRAVGGFDPALRYAEDVDLVWRLSRSRVVRYEPEYSAVYRPRTSVSALARRRWHYARGSASVHVRHGHRGGELRMSPWSAAFWAAVLARRWTAAAGLFVYSAAALRPLLDHDRPAATAVRMVGLGNAGAGRAIARAAVRSHWPLTVLALARPRSRTAAACLVSIACADRAIEGRREGIRGPLLAILDDLATGGGTWAGALRRRSAIPLLPDLGDVDYRPRPFRHRPFRPRPLRHGR